MTTQILTTKLFIPSPPPNLVARPRLRQRLDQGASGKLTLISAQAGYGKTTLLSEWISQCKMPVCWLSLDENDNDIHRFLRYVFAALRNIITDFSESALIQLQSAKTRETENLLTGLVNKIITSANPFVFVLDDYHVITDLEIQQALQFVLEHLPPQMHLIISSRSDPPWPLTRLKVRGEMLEIRSQEMRFTVDEAATFLNDRMGLTLSPEDIAALERRTEGWIVGLQMAALSVQYHSNKEAFIQAFTGSHRYVVDYLVEEVLSQQTPEFREFLLTTSILTRLTGSLCDAVLDRHDSQAVLRELEQKNLFLIPLDEERRWYRYHHLFAELLRYHLQQDQASEVQILHKKASLWYEENDLYADAVNHALVANELERIVQLTNGLIVYKLDNRELRTLLNWLERLPKSSIETYPWLLVTRAWALFNLGKYDDVDANLLEIESVLSNQALSGTLANRIRGHTAAIRSYMAELREEPQLAMQQAEDALAFLPDEDILLRAFVAIRWANCLVWFGDLEKAIPVYREAGESCKRVGEGQLAITALSEMAVIQMISGKLHQSVESVMDVCNYAESLAKRDGRRLPAMGILYRHMSAISREQNELRKAAHYAREAVKICKQWGEKESLLGALSALARVHFSRGEYARVDRRFQEVLQVAGEISDVYTTQMMTWIIHYQLLLGKIDQAEKWVCDLNLASGQVFGYDSHQVYYNFARYLYLKGDYQQALRVVEDLLKIVNRAGAGMFAIRYKTFQAILFDREGRKEDAMTAIREALSSARTEGYVRSILDEGNSVGDILQTTISRGIEADFAGLLLQVLRPESKPPSLQVPAPANLLEPLSQREVEVLRLLTTDLTAPEMADELMISASTVRSHIKSIYSKLDVHSRYEAVWKAKELSLF